MDHVTLNIGVITAEHSAFSVTSKYMYVYILPLKSLGSVRLFMFLKRFFGSSRLYLFDQKYRKKYFVKYCNLK